MFLKSRACNFFFLFLMAIRPSFAEWPFGPYHFKWPYGHIVWRANALHLFFLNVGRRSAPYLPFILYIYILNYFYFLFIFYFQFLSFLFLFSIISFLFYYSFYFIYYFIICISFLTILSIFYYFLFIWTLKIYSCIFNTPN